MLVNIIVLMLSLSFVLSAGLAFFAYRHRINRTARMFVLVLCICMIWSIEAIITLQISNPQTLWIFALINNAFTAQLAPLILLIAIFYTGIPPWFKNNHALFLFIIPALTVVLISTSGFHKLYHIGYSLNWAGQIPVLRINPGIAYKIYIFYSYTLLFTAFLLVTLSLFEKSKFHRRQVLMMLVGLFIPLINDILYNLGYPIIENYNLTPVFFSVGNIFVAWSLYHYRFFKLLPVARSKVIDNMSDGMLIVNESGIIIDLNKTLLDKFLLTNYKYIGKSFREVFHSYPGLINFVEKSENSEIEITINNQFWYFDGTISTIEGSENQMINRIILLRDITKRKIAEDLVRLNNARLEDLLHVAQLKEASMEDILDFGLETALKITRSKIGFIYYFDEETRLFTLYSWSKGVMDECSLRDKRKNYELDKAGIWGEVVRQRKPILVNDFSAPNELKKGYPEGHVRLHRFLSVPVINENKIVAVMGVGNKDDEYNETDITQLLLLSDSVWTICEKKQDDEKIKEFANQLKLLNATKDKLFTIIAHDLKTPFNSILGFSDLLFAHLITNNTEQAKVSARIIQSTAESTYKLLNNLLDWAKSQTGQLHYNPQMLDLHSIIEQIKEFSKPSATIKNIQILNQSHPACQVYADTNMLETILRNLISNAIKYTPHGGNVWIKTIALDKMIEINVTDTGIGMNEELKNRLFLPGEKKSLPGTANEKGSGLGLILCKEFVEKNGGQIRVESEPGKGSSFSFTLPSLKSASLQ